MAKTAARVANMFGEKLYQQRARRALPALVRQARLRKPIYYESLAAELGMSNPRNLNWVLGSVGATLGELAKDPEWDEDIPHIQSLVINQNRRLPGPGFDGFLADRHPEFATLPLSDKRAYLEGYWHDIFAYRHWDDVLQVLELGDTRDTEHDLIARAKTGRGGGGGGGEGVEHLHLKQYVRDNPGLVGLPFHAPPGRTEARLASGDSVDVLFEGERRTLAIEVKSKISNDVDLIRGLFQCVKYAAVIAAEAGYNGERRTVEAALVVGRPFPDELLGLRNALHVRVIEIMN